MEQNPNSMVEYGFRRAIITITVILCALLELIDTSIVNVATTQLMGNLGATLGEVSWVIAAYSIANVIIVPMAGWLSSFFGRKNYFAGSVIIFTVASILCGNSTSIWELVFFRFIQGIGGGALLATAQSILVEIFPPEQRGLSTALFGMGVIMGPTLGPTVGGYLIDNFDWPMIFYVNIPIGIVATILTIKYIRNQPIQFRQNTGTIDWLGMALLVAGIGSLQYVLEQGDREDWFDSQTITFFAILAVVGIICFIWRELTTPNPIVDLSIIKKGNVGIGLVMSFVLGFGLFASVFIYPVFAQRFLGFTALQTGLSLLPGALFSGMMMPMVGGMLQKGVPPTRMIVFGFLGFAAFTFYTQSIMTPQASDSDFFIPLLLRGFSLGMLFVPLTNLALTGLSPRDIPQASGLTSMIRQLGGSFSVALVSVFQERRIAQHRSDILSHITAYDPNTAERLNTYTNGFMGRGNFSLDKAQQMGNAALEYTVQKQSFLLTYIDIFLYLGIFFICCLPLVLFTKKLKTTAKVDTSAAH